MSGWRPIRAASRAMYFDAMSSSGDGALRPRNSVAPRNRTYGFMSSAEMSFTPFDCADAPAERPRLNTYAIDHDTSRRILTPHLPSRRLIKVSNRMPAPRRTGARRSPGHPAVTPAKAGVQDHRSSVSCNGWAGRIERPFVRRRDGQDPDALVRRQRQCLRACRHVDRVGEQVRVRVRVVAAVGRMSMRGEPGDRRALDEARRQARELLHRPHPRRRAGRRRGRSGPRGTGSSRAFQIRLSHWPM